MSLNRDLLYKKHISSKKLNKELPLIFDRGWSPVLKPIYDGTRVVLQIVEWIGGEGEKPFDPSISSYYLSTILKP